MATPRRARFLLLAATVAGFVSGCGDLDSVSEETVQSVAGGDVVIVDEVEYPNPTDNWLYTYLLLEVRGPPPRRETVLSTLASNGWDVSVPDATDVDPPGYAVADRPGATLTLVGLADFVEPGPFTRPEKKFAEFPVRVDRDYFVAIIMPLDR